MVQATTLSFKLLLILNVLYVTLTKRSPNGQFKKTVKIVLLHEYITKLFIVMLFVLWKHSARNRITKLAVV